MERRTDYPSLTIWDSLFEPGKTNYFLHQLSAKKKPDCLHVQKQFGFSHFALSVKPFRKNYFSEIPAAPAFQSL
ncbi:MAG: hypothetical protein DRG35_06840 [Deltaproteobacteria bacterium]|nr:MAG: hypothetical protein DRG35_06840 [Deltaproteobacteria bacterium]RLB37047.1 MAG: hypothetical protein DRH12_14890 [Deltaproteobacteria bacterium]